LEKLMSQLKEAMVLRVEAEVELEVVS